MPRAAPLPPDERRATLLSATEPLLERYGREISTRQIAEAAGVAEGTIFRAFPTKDALIEACLEDAFGVDSICAELAAIPTARATATRTVTATTTSTSASRGADGAEADAELERVLVAAVTLLQARLRRVIALFHATRPPAPSRENVGDLRARHARDNHRVTTALADLLAPFADRLRRPPAEAAALVNTVTFALTHPMMNEGPPSPPIQTVDLILHGVLAPPDEALVPPKEAPC